MVTLILIIALACV